MKRRLAHGAVALAAGVIPLSLHAQTPVDSTAHAPFFNFETGPVQPLVYDASANLLMIANTVDHRVEFYQFYPGGNFLFAGSILTGLEPSSMCLDDVENRLFVANHLSDSVTVIDVPTRRVVGVIQVGDEPTDVALVQADPQGNRPRLYVTCTRGHDSHPVDLTSSTDRAYDEQVVAIFESTPPFAHIANVPIDGHKPRRVLASGTDALIIPQNSGNHTVTVEDVVLDALGANPFSTSVGGIALDPGPFPYNPVFDALDDGPAGAPTLPVFGVRPPGWQTPFSSRVVLDSERNSMLALLAGGPSLPGGTPAPLTLPDRDLVRVQGLTHVTSAWQGAMTTQLNMAMRPATSDVWIVGQDARNRTRFESSLTGTAVDNLVAVIDTSNPTATPVPIPLDAAMAPAEGAQPVAVAFYAGSLAERVFIACLGTGNVLAMSPSAFQSGTGAASGAVIPVGLPMALAVDDVNDRLFVFSREDHAVHIYAIPALGVPFGAPTATIPLYNPEPEGVQVGRTHLYDARASTHHGDNSVSCASCHVFGDLDQLSWDLGRPLGAIETGHPNFLVTHDNSTPRTVIDPMEPAHHPIKGPMMTQTLRGFEGAEALHWRGDRPFFHMFQGAFDGLLGAVPDSNGDTVTLTDMQEFATFNRSLVHPPSPYQPLTRNWVGDANLGRNLYTSKPYGPAITTCVNCHVIDFVSEFSGAHPAILNDGLRHVFNVPQIRANYEKQFRHLTGFGLAHDGRIPTLRDFLDGVNAAGAQAFSNFTTFDRDHTAAFMTQWDSGLAPMVGAEIFISEASAPSSGPTLAAFEAQAQLGNVDVVGKGVLSGFIIGLVYDPAANLYRADDTSASTVPASSMPAVLATPGGNASFVFLCVPPGTGERIGVDQDEDGVWDGIEVAININPANPDSDSDGYDDGLEISTSPGQPGNPSVIPNDVTRPTVTLVEPHHVFHTVAALRVEVSEPTTVSVRVSVGGVTLTTVTGNRLARVHDLVLPSLIPATQHDLAVTVTDTAGNTGAGTGSFTTEVPHYFVDDVVITGPNGMGVLTGEIHVVDQDGNPVPDGTTVWFTWVENGVFAPAGGAATTLAGVAINSFTPSNPASPSNPISVCVGAVGSAIQANPDFVGFTLPDGPGKIFYAAANNKKSFATKQ